MAKEFVKIGIYVGFGIFFILFAFLHPIKGLEKSVISLMCGGASGWYFGKASKEITNYQKTRRGESVDKFIIMNPNKKNNTEEN